MTIDAGVSRVTKCNTCVCGCPQVRHWTMVLSVELLPRPEGPIYPINADLGRQPNVTRFTERCGCGCMSFESMPDDW